MNTDLMTHVIMKAEAGSKFFGKDVRSYISSKIDIEGKDEFLIYDNDFKEFKVRIDTSQGVRLFSKDWYNKYPLKKGDWIIVKFENGKIYILPSEKGIVNPNIKTSKNHIEKIIPTIIKEIRESQFLSNEPEKFEKHISEAFTILGFKSVHLGKQNNPDILIKDFDIIIDTKTTKEGVISERAINFDSMERYRNKYNSKFSCIIAPGYSDGNIRDSSVKRDIKLIETETICRLLENHLTIQPYELDEIVNLLFRSDKLIISSIDIPFPKSETVSKVSIVADILLILKNFEKSDINIFSIDELKIALIGTGKKYSNEQIRSSIEFISTPPFCIVNEIDSKYEILINMGTLSRKIGILSQAFNQFLSLDR